jgi:NTP pyrophosphatase (non-canonical NTP hydrolase)
VTDWGKIWDDQFAFNLKFRPDPTTDEERAEQIKDLVLLLQSELHELLNTVAWKKHRRDPRYRPNMGHSAEELTDVFKYFITLCNLFRIRPEELAELYWKKSAVCEQRYVEEWVSAYARRVPMARVALVDLDNVIFDYVSHFGQYLKQCITTDWDGGYDATLDRIDQLIAERGWLSAKSTGMQLQMWNHYKHSYRVTGQKAHMPLMPYAKLFLQTLRATDHVIVIVTSRPIDVYPNLMADTIACLNMHGLPYDHVWHGLSKKTVIVERLDPRPSQLIAIDDDPQYVQEYVSLDIPTYHVINGSAAEGTIAGATVVSSLKEVIDHLAILT